MHDTSNKVRPEAPKASTSPSGDPCAPQTKLFTIEVDQTWHQSVCFTPDRAYERSFARISVKNILFNFDLGTVGTLCKSCSMTP